MQLIDTHVENANQAMVTGEFAVEGGEFVLMKIAAGGGLQGNVVNRAKVMMAQLFTFEEDCETAQDEWRRSDHPVEERTEEGLTETDSVVPAVSRPGDTPASTA